MAFSRSLALRVKGRLFFKAWRELSDEGLCDAPQGAEYVRIQDLWIKAGRPDDMKQFIRLAVFQSNRAPDPRIEARPLPFDTQGA